MHHSSAVVGKPDQPPPARLDVKPEIRRARIERIFEQLLYDASRPLHHLTRGDFIGNVVGKDANAAHWKKAPGATRHTPVKIGFLNWRLAPGARRLLYCTAMPRSSSSVPSDLNSASSLKR